VAVGRVPLAVFGLVAGRVCYLICWCLEIVLFRGIGFGFRGVWFLERIRSAWT